jgi:hypothetical protein
MADIFGDLFQKALQITVGLGTTVDNQKHGALLLRIRGQGSGEALTPSIIHDNYC